MRSAFHWNLGTRSLELGERTLIMGVLNVTPDSFSDGGKHFDRDRAVSRAIEMLQEGAAIIDVGGESTRPGAQVTVQSEESGREPATFALTAEEEIERVIPVIQKLKKRAPATIVSIDTYKAAVARAAVEAGAEIVNDVSGFRWDPDMANTLAELNCGAVLMHTRGQPNQWRKLPPTPDVVELVKHDLNESAQAAFKAGVRRDAIVLDPGFGFGKRLEENYPLVAHFDYLHELGFPLLAGVSRKSFIGRMLAENGEDAPLEARHYGSLATEIALMLKGAHIIRTHEVRPAVEAARVVDAILRTN